MEYRRRRSHGNVAGYHHHQHFLFEATGDSEDDSFLVEYSEENLQNFIWMNILGGFPFIVSNTDEDDAESCSCDSIDENRDFLDSNDITVEEEEVMEEVEVEDDEEEVAMPPVPKDHSRNTRDGAHHGSKKMMENEMEADRLFWETCLEAGYP